MAFTELTSGSSTISASEVSLLSASTTLQSNTTDGILQVYLELNNFTDTEVYEFKIKEKVTSASTQRVVHYETLAFDPGTSENYVSPPIIVMHGWDATLKKLSGTDRAIAWSIRLVT